MDIPLAVTSQECLACRGCCRFHAPDDAWSPRLTAEDAALLLKAQPDGGWQGGGGRLALKACQSGHACPFLEEGSGKCGVYDDRPFECRLYPFLLSREDTGFRVYAHTSCPAIQRDGASSHAQGIRELFRQDAAQRFAQENAANFADYSSFRDEVEEVYAFDPGAGLWAQRQLIEEALSRNTRTLSSLSFVNLFAWQGFFRFDVEAIDGAVCVFAAQPAGIFLYWPPLGENIPASAVATCFEKMRAVNRGGSLTRVENVAADELRFFDERLYRFEPRGHEYVYDRARVALLRGQGYKSRRGDANMFRRRYAGMCNFRPYAPSDFNACALLFDRWLDGRLGKYDNDVYGHMLRENRSVHRLVLAYAPQLGLVGRVVAVNGKLVAYTFGYELGPDTFCVLFEIADLEVKGLAAFVFRALCADPALENFTRINAMDDFAAEQLGRTKMSWRPQRLEPVYAVLPRE